MTSLPMATLLQYLRHDAKGAVLHHPPQDRFVLSHVFSGQFCQQLEKYKELPGVGRTYDPVFGEYGVVLYNKGYQMIELFILLQLIEILTPGSNLIDFYKDQNEVGVRTSISHK